MSQQTTFAPPSPGFIDALSGNWINRRRLTAGLAACLLLALAAAWALFGDARPPFDGAGRPLGLDFSALWGAGKAAQSGDYTSAYSLPWFLEHLRSLFADGAQKLVWAYPPIFYFLLMPLAALPYGAALIVWLGAGFAVLAVLARQIIRDPIMLLAIVAFPGIFGNAIHGQTGFLTAALFTGALLALPTRPALAGVLFACLAYKPQFALLIPVALLAGGYWRALAFSVLTGILLITASLLAFGLDSWAAFFDAVQNMRERALDQGGNGYHNMISSFGAARHFGLSLYAAWAAQAAAAAALATGLIAVWRSRADFRLKSAMLLVAALGFTPYGLDYDLVLLGPAIAFIASFGLQHGFRVWDHTLLAIAFVTPPLVRYFAFFLGVPLAQFAVLSIFALIWVHTAQNTRGGP